MEGKQHKFQQFLQKMASESLYRKAITHEMKHFDIKSKELLKITPKAIRHQRQFLNTKVKQGSQQNSQWSQAQKKLFNWVLLCYLYIHKTTVPDLTDQDCFNLAQLTIEKTVPLVRYHCFSMLKQHKRPAWSKEEDEILFKILAVDKQLKTVGEWSQVSRELFIRGQQNSFKSGKNCRERWFNHVDPNINKHWSKEEDLIMLKEILDNGRKWSKAISLLNGSKSEHMIKNRFHSLLKKKQHEIPEEDEDRVVGLIIEDIKKQIEEDKRKEAEKEKARKAKQKETLKVEEGPAIRVTRSNSNNSFRSFKSRKESFEPVIENNMNIFGLGDNGQTYQWLGEKGFLKEDQEEDNNQNQGAFANAFQLNQSIRFKLASPLPPSPANFGEELCFKNYSAGFVQNIKKV